MGPAVPGRRVPGAPSPPSAEGVPYLCCKRGKSLVGRNAPPSVEVPKRNLATLESSRFDGAVPFANAARNVLWAAQVVWNFHILVCLNTGYYFRGHLVCTQPGLAAGYLKTWFAFDAANIIVDWLLAAMDVSHNLASRVALKEVNAAVRGLWTMQTALRLSRLVSLRGKLQSFNRHLSDKAGASSIIALTVGQICLMHHVLACSWYGIGILGTDGSWVQANGLDGASVAYRYATALHWTFCQIGLGSSEIEAVNTQERLFSLFLGCAWTR